MRAKRAPAVLLLSAIMCWAIFPPLALGLESGYRHFIGIDIDGKREDWAAVPSTLFVTKVRPQLALEINITEAGFAPENATIPLGGSIVWENRDPRTEGGGRRHQIALGESAPVTWTSLPIDYGRSDYLLVEETGNYPYHTSRVDFVTYPEGLFSAVNATELDIGYGISVANTQSQLFLALSVENVSISPSDGGRYLKGVDILVDDFADGALEGNNAARIRSTGEGFLATDMYYTSGRLEDDRSGGGGSDVTVAYSHTIPERENKTAEYLGDLFLEIAFPIDSDEIRDLGAGPGREIGLEVILRVSDLSQDERAAVPGVSGHYQGGGYPQIYTHGDLEGEISPEPSGWVVVELSGGTLLERLRTAALETWIWLVSALAAASAVLTGALVAKSRGGRCPEPGGCGE